MPEETIEQQVERCVREHARKVVEDMHYPNAAHVLIRDSFQPLVLALAKANENIIESCFTDSDTCCFCGNRPPWPHSLGCPVAICEAALALLKERR